MPQKLLIAVKPTFRAPVKLLLAGDDLTPVELQFNAIFKRLTKTQREVIGNGMQAKTLTDAEFVDAVLDGWDGLDAADGAAYVFTPENLAAAEEDWPGFLAAIVVSWFAYNQPAAVKN
ncbi:hypothetical protein BH10PSE18_BH10PSE18_19070 [soil metagenome]